VLTHIPSSPCPLFPLSPLQLLSLAEQQGGLTTLLANWTSATIHQLAPMFVMDHAVAM
jgi:hypothetical protein